MRARGDVLVVDDDEDLREVIATVLQGAGYGARTVANGRLALDAASSSMPALIIVDVIMPVMNGCEFVRTFRATFGDHVPIVVMTAAEHASSRCAGLDVSGVLSKPFGADELLRIVGSHVAG